MEIIAACDVCGRGYLTLHHEGVRCLANDLGRVWRLPSPERMDDDTVMHRERRLRKLEIRANEDGRCLRGLS